MIDVIKKIAESFPLVWKQNDTLEWYEECFYCESEVAEWQSEVGHAPDCLWVRCREFVKKYEGKKISLMVIKDKGKAEPILTSLYPFDDTERTEKDEE